MGFNEAARTVLRDCLAVRRTEVVYILADTECRNVATALHHGALEMADEVFLTYINPRNEHQEELPRPIREAMKYVDVIIAPTTFSLSHTEALKTALKKGARVVTMPGITSHIFSIGGITADYKAIESEVYRVYKKIRKSKRARIWSDMGTDIEVELADQQWINDDNGLCHKKGQFTNLPAGELFTPTVEGGADGTVIIDGSIGGRKLESPVTLRLEEGVVKSLKGAAWLKDVLLKYGRASRSVSELGFGMNPRSRIVGNVLEDKKVLGSVHLSFGDNSRIGGTIECPHHIDAVMTGSSLFLDDEPVIENGKLTA